MVHLKIEPGKKDLYSKVDLEIRRRAETGSLFSSPGRSSHPWKFVFICLLTAVSPCLDRESNAPHRRDPPSFLKNYMIMKILSSKNRT